MPKHGREQLADYRWRSKVKAYELADLLGITESFLSQLLSGKRLPGLPTAVAIEEATGIPVKSWVPSQRGRLGKRKRANTKTRFLSKVLTHA